jgi:hypothetical protein
MGEAIPDTEQHAGLGVDVSAVSDYGRAPDGEIAKLRQCEYAEHDGHQR